MRKMKPHPNDSLNRIIRMSKKLSVSALQIDDQYSQATSSKLETIHTKMQTAGNEIIRLRIEMITNHLQIVHQFMQRAGMRNMR